MNQSINTDSKNSKEPQQKYRLGTVSIKILGGLNQDSYNIPCGNRSPTSTTSERTTLHKRHQRRRLYFLCRKSGHWKKDFPELAQKSNNKINKLNNQTTCIKEIKITNVWKLMIMIYYKEWFSNEATNAVYDKWTRLTIPYCYLFLLSVFILWFTYYVSNIF